MELNGKKKLLSRRLCTRKRKQQLPKCAHCIYTIHIQRNNEWNISFYLDDHLVNVCRMNSTPSSMKSLFFIHSTKAFAIIELSAQNLFNLITIKVATHWTLPTLCAWIMNNKRLFYNIFWIVLFFSFITHDHYPRDKILDLKMGVSGECISFEKFAVSLF